MLQLWLWTKHQAPDAPAKQVVSVPGAMRSTMSRATVTQHVRAVLHHCHIQSSMDHGSPQDWHQTTALRERAVHTTSNCLQQNTSSADCWHRDGHVAPHGAHDCFFWKQQCSPMASKTLMLGIVHEVLRTIVLFTPGPWTRICILSICMSGGSYGMLFYQYQSPALLQLPYSVALNWMEQQELG